LTSPVNSRWMQNFPSVKSPNANARDVIAAGRFELRAQEFGHGAGEAALPCRGPSADEGRRGGGAIAAAMAAKPVVKARGQTTVGAKRQGQRRCVNGANDKKRPRPAGKTVAGMNLPPDEIR